MTDCVEQSWSMIESLSDSMRAAAAEQAWERVVELAVTRHRILLAHFQRFPIGPDNATFYNDRLTQMLQGERELQTLAVEARRRVMRDGANSSRNHRAVGAYLAQ
jgi:hypothetical protein